MECPETEISAEDVGSKKAHSLFFRPFVHQILRNSDPEETRTGDFRTLFPLKGFVTVFYWP